MNELIMPHNVGVKNALEDMKKLLLGSKDINWVTNKKPNSFTNPPQFAFSPNLNFPVLPRIAFITGRIALMFQNLSLVTTFFANFAEQFFFMLWRR